ncbi:MAG: NAD(P)H-hydrate dehydratase [Bacteroidaceae bacterium]|nr:NAD(P)H-hydrate dehydratase [Bacteroidaceae bacterium]
MKTTLCNIGREDLRKILHPRPADGHKGTFGHALLVAGCAGMGGAAILAAEACLRSGVGKLSVRTAEANHLLLQMAVPEAILAPSPDATEYDARGIGPGLGRHSSSVLNEFLQTVSRPSVFDADALNILSQQPDWLPRLPRNSILTPHPGEAKRLIGSSSVEDASAFAQTYSVIVVLKGHPSHVCAPDGDVYRLDVGNSGMATAGSGDVLTGLVTGLLAQGQSPMESALLGVWLHGTAGDFAAKVMGKHCMLARDIIRHLPEAFREMKR